MLHIRKIDNAAFALGVGELLGKILRHAHKLLYRLEKFAHMQNHFVSRREEIFFAQGVNFFLVSVAQIFNRFLDDKFIAREFSAAEACKVNRPNFIVSGVPICAGTFQIVNLIKIFGNDVDFDIIFFGKASCLRAFVKNFIKRLGNMRRDNFAEPTNIFKLNIFGQIVGRGKRIKPRVGIRQAQRKIMQVQNHFVNFIVAVNRAAEGVREIFKSRVALRVIFLEKVFDNFLL